MVDETKREITRSFSYKVNLGNYQTADFFCSQKAEVPEEDAEKTSEALYEFCKNEVMKSVERYLKENAPKVKANPKLKNKLTEKQINSQEEGAKFQKKYNEESKMDEERVQLEQARELKV